MPSPFNREVTSISEAAGHHQGWHILGTRTRSWGSPSIAQTPIPLRSDATCRDDSKFKMYFSWTSGRCGNIEFRSRVQVASTGQSHRWKNPPLFHCGQCQTTNKTNVTGFMAWIMSQIPFLVAWILLNLLFFARGIILNSQFFWLNRIIVNHVKSQSLLVESWVKNQHSCWFLNVTSVCQLKFQSSTKSAVKPWPVLRQVLQSHKGSTAFGWVCSHGPCRTEIQQGHGWSINLRAS